MRQGVRLAMEFLRNLYADTTDLRAFPSAVLHCMESGGRQRKEFFNRYNSQVLGE